MARKTKAQNRQADNSGDEGSEDERPSPAEINAGINRSRLNRIEEIGRVADGQRAGNMSDVDGHQVTGRFADGEFDDSPEARERKQVLEDELAEQDLEDRRREAEAEEDDARRLQEEGGDDNTRSRQRDDDRDDEADEESVGDEKVINGVRHYLTVEDGQEKWLTLKQLRERATGAGNVEKTLQAAQDALQRATQASLTPKEDEAEDLTEKDLENVILSASMGDEEAVKKLASVLRSRPKGHNPQDVSSMVAQQIATTREVDLAERDITDLVGNGSLEPVFRQRLREFATQKPQTRIKDAYKAVADQMRKDFAPMLKQSNEPLSKEQRKRTIINPPQSAGRQPRREDEDREVPVSEQIDALARMRGQQRAHRVRRS